MCSGKLSTLTLQQDIARTQFSTFNQASTKILSNMIQKTQQSSFSSRDYKPRKKGNLGGTSKGCLVRSALFNQCWSFRSLFVSTHVVWPFWTTLPGVHSKENWVRKRTLYKNWRPQKGTFTKIGNLKTDPSQNWRP